MSRTKPGRVVRIPDSLAESWDGVFVLARRRLAESVALEPEDIPTGKVWDEIVGVLVEHYCGAESRQIIGVDVRLEMLQGDVTFLKGMVEDLVRASFKPLTDKPFEPEGD